MVVDIEEYLATEKTRPRLSRDIWRALSAMALVQVVRLVEGSPRRDRGDGVVRAETR